MLMHEINKAEKGYQYNYVSRRIKKRMKRREWIEQINAGMRNEGMNYSIGINKLKNKKIIINRKMLGILASQENVIFKQLLVLIKGI